MKKVFKTIAAVALVAFAASCEKAPVESLARGGEETEVSFTVATPQIFTKAIADGNTVDEVACNVYDATGALIDNAEISKIVPMTGGKAEFKVRLVTGQTYSFIFWAYKAPAEGETSPYTLDAAAKTVTVDYEGYANDETRDAFYACVEKKIEGAVNETVTLYRPFAQLNFGVDPEDIIAAEKAGYVVTQSSVSVKGLANVLDLTTGEVDGTVDADFVCAALPAQTLTVGEDEYGYVAMNYVLVGKDEKTTADVTLTTYNDGNIAINTLSLPAVPLQGNYRTNILGNLFTSQVIYTIVVDPSFEDPDYVKELWDGTADEPEVDESGNYLITTANELAWVAQQVNSGKTTFVGKTLVLQNDIDLCNVAWTPIGIMQYTPGKSFYGTFDGNGKTISNLNVSDNTAEWASAGLFGGTVSATIKNLNVENATVNSTHYAGVIVGYAQEGTNILDCAVTNVSLTSTPELLASGEWDNGDKVGAIAGHFEGIKIEGCTVKDAAIRGYRDLGAIAGNVNYATGAVINNTVEGDVLIIVDKTHNYKNYTELSKHNAGAYVGRIGGASATVSGNSGEDNVTIVYALTVSDSEELNAAIENASADETANIILESGVSVTLKSGIANDGAKSRNVAIIGDGSQTFDVVSGAVTAEGGKLNYQRGSTFTLRNVTVKAGEGSFDGVVCDELVLDNCSLSGKLTLFGKATFTDCTFENTMSDQYSIWTWGGTDVKIEDCVFNTNGKAVLLYGQATAAKPTNLSVSNTIFNDRNNGAAGKAAIEIGNDYSATYNLTISGCTVNGFAPGKNTDSKVWANKNSMDAEHLSVTIDGVRVL